MTVEQLRQLHDEARKAYGHMVLLGQGIGALDRERRDAICRHDEVFGPASEPDVLGVLLDIAELAEQVLTAFAHAPSRGVSEEWNEWFYHADPQQLAAALSRLDTEGGT